MKGFLSRFFSYNQPRSSSFGEFLRTATEAEKKRVFTKAAKGANKDQQDLVERYNQLTKKAAS